MLLSNEFKKVVRCYNPLYYSPGMILSFCSCLFLAGGEHTGHSFLNFSRFFFRSPLKSVKRGPAVRSFPPTDGIFTFQFGAGRQLTLALMRFFDLSSF